MHLGYTYQDVVGCKMKVIAERRKSDHKIQFTCIPEGRRIKFTFDEAFSAQMGSDWHFGEPLLKIKGTYIVDNGWVNYSTTTTIFIKDVENFTAVPILKTNVFSKTL